MDYEIKKVVEEIDLLSLDKDEFDKLNQFYHDIVSKRYPKLKELHQIYPVKRVIMSDDLSRIEVLVALKDDVEDLTPKQIAANLSSSRAEQQQTKNSSEQ